MRKTSKPRRHVAQATDIPAGKAKDATPERVEEPVSAETEEPTVPDTSAKAPGGPSSPPVWRSTRLRSGHVGKIDYLKLHNASTVVPTRGSPSGALLQGSTSHRKRPAASSVATPTASAADKRPRLQERDALVAHQSPSAAPSYSCPVCAAVLSSSKSFDQHMLANHMDAQPFGCVFCDTKVRTTKALQHHYVRQHRVCAPVPDCMNWRLTRQCRACGQSFRTTEHLARHMEWTQSQCSSIVLMEKLPDNWRWTSDAGAILESADAVEEEYNLAFPGRQLFYGGHPGLLDADMSIRLQPAGPSAAAAAAAAKPAAAAAVLLADGSAGGDVDVFAFVDESGVSGEGEIEVDVVPTPSKDAGAFSSGNRRRRGRPSQLKHARKPALEIDFEQLLKRGDAMDNEIDAEADTVPHQPPPQQKKAKQQQQQSPTQPPQRQRMQQRQSPQQRRSQLQQQPFVTEKPHYVSSRASVPGPQQSFPCPICMADMATLKSRDRHLLQRHPGVRAFACLECDCTFETYIALRRHVRAEHPHAESGAYKLLIAPGLRRRANQRAASASTVASAVAAGRGALRPFLCTVCGASFDLVHQLSAHFASSHEGSTGRVGRMRAGAFAGRDGGAALQESADIDLDASTAASLAGKSDAISAAGLDDLKLTCELCSAQFEKIAALECHIASDHVDETPYECHQCPAYFPSLGRLRHHQRTVHMIFPQWKEPPQAVISKLRANTTTNASVLSLAVALRRSDMAKVAFQQLRFFDSQSGASINLESLLAGMPASDTVIHCDFCGESCHNKLELGRHLQSHSGKRLRFGCSRCGQVFEGWNAKSDLVDHMKVDHMGKARYRCSQCEAQFKYSSLLKQHKERGCNSQGPVSRPVVSYGCSTCDKLFCGEQSAERYRRHMQVCRGLVNRALPSSAAVQPPPTAVISGLDGVEGADAGGEESAAAAGYQAAANSAAATDRSVAGSTGGSTRIVQMTLPGSKEPVSVLIHLEGPLTPDALSQAFIVQSELGGDDGDPGAAAADDVEPLQSLADAAAAAASAATAAGPSAADPSATAVPFLA